MFFCWWIYNEDKIVNNECMDGVVGYIKYIVGC